jgi:hypothetical protein
MLTGHRLAAVDVVLKCEPGAPEELWLEEGAEQLASGPASRPLQRRLEFVFKSPGEQRKDLLIALRTPLPFCQDIGLWHACKRRRHARCRAAPALYGCHTRNRGPGCSGADAGAAGGRQKRQPR